MQLFCDEDSPIHSQPYENMCVQFHHYHTQNFEQKLMLLTKFVKKRQKTYITKSNLMQVFCNEHSPIHSKLSENVSANCVLLKYSDKLYSIPGLFRHLW